VWQDVGMSEPVPICSECGKRIERQGFVRGKLEFLSPIFCSTTCANVYDPSNLTFAKISGLAAWLPPYAGKTDPA